MLVNLRSELTVRDLAVGIGAAAALAALLAGFRYQPIPNYHPGDTAREDVRARQDFTFEDTEATSRRRELARSGIPVIYDLNSKLVAERVQEISRAFAEGRDVIAELPASSPPKSGVPPRVPADIERIMSGKFPRDVLGILLSQRFNASLEGQLIRILDTLLREGIVRDADRAQFLSHQRFGIVIRDEAKSRILPLGEAYVVRDLTAARERLRQHQSDLASLPAPDRTVLLSFLETRLFATLQFNERETAAGRQAAAAQVPPAEVHVRQGKIVMRSGELITPGIAKQLDALRALQRPGFLFWQFLGFLLFALIFVYSLWRYLVHHQDRHREIRRLMLLTLLILASVILVMRLITELAEILGERLSIDVLGNPYLLDYAIPFAFGGLLVTLLVDTNFGILTSVIVASMTGLFYNDVHLMSYVLVGSLAGIFSVRQYRDRAALQKAGLTIAVVGAIGILGIDLLRQGPPAFSGTFGKMAFALVSGLLTTATASMLLPPLESLFKITTDLRLLELSNLNAPILRRLSVEAPGTYHHSLMVGTLSEGAAEAIGANPLLLRVGAYYHDLGKMMKPEYFAENQTPDSNKHENLTPSTSCLILAGHINDGIEMAREAGLVDRILDLIPQHHGTRVMTYFFQKAKDSQEMKGQDLEETNYRYPGPKPQTKEAAIMMMADSVEAASRTLSRPSGAQIQGMIDRLVDEIVNDGQFDECDITLRDIRRVKQSFFKILTGIYHRRIDYPGYDFKDSGGETGGSGEQNSSIKPSAPVSDPTPGRGIALLGGSERA